MSYPQIPSVFVVYRREQRGSTMHDEIDRIYPGTVAGETAANEFASSSARLRVGYSVGHYPVYPVTEATK